MALKEELETLVNVYKSDHVRKVLSHNQVLFDIYEGDLLEYIKNDLKAQLSENAYNQIIHRIAPINVLKRVIDKLSKIYAKAPLRKLNSDSQTDAELLGFYKKSYDIDTNMGLANEFFNLFKTCAIEPYLDDGKPRLRILPSDRYFVYSTDTVNPLRPTHFVKIMGKFKVGNEDRMLFFAYTKDEFHAFDDKGETVGQYMEKNQGKNPYGAIPVVYVNRSRHDLIPKIDTDTLAMTKLVPILLSDINYAVMFQAFSILYGIDVDDQNLKIAPNVFWRFKSDPAKDTKPEVGVIKPEVDTDKVLNLISSQLVFWMQSRNIRPGSIGTLTAENFQSGISKAIDEMDTSEDRQKQVPFFVEADERLWDLTINHLHPVWVKDPKFEHRASFSKGVSVSVSFPEQRPLVDTSKVIDDQIKLIDKGLETRRGALRAIHPDWADEQIEEKLKEIEEESLALGRRPDSETTSDEPNEEPAA